MTTVLAHARFTTPVGEIVNTFNFDSPSGFASYILHAAAATDAIEDFYGIIGNTMCNWISRFYEIRTYNFADPTPRVPFSTDHTLDPPTNSGVPNCPADVAMCVTYHAAPPVTRRRRGRLYLAGIGSDSIAPGGTTSIPSFALGSLSMRTKAAEAATNLIAHSAGWCVWSRAANAFYPVVGGYIDTEPDTQRRRGDQTTAPVRLTFGV